MLIQTFFIKSIEAEQKQEENPYEDVQEEFSQILFSTIPQLDTKSAFTNISKPTNVLEEYVKRELFAIWNFDQKNCKQIIDFFKQIVMMTVVFLRYFPFNSSFTQQKKWTFTNLGLAF